MKVVLAQIAPSLGDLDRNLSAHLSEARSAARAGADLVVFPELSLTGYLLQDLASECARDARDAQPLKRLAAASKRVGIVAGFVERSGGLLIHNAAGCWLGGALAHLHRKVYLPTYGMFDEGRYFAAGEVFRTFEAPWGRTGLLVCEDFWHLSSSYLLAQEGMDVLVVISASPLKGLDVTGRPVGEAWLQMAQVVARFLGCFVVYVNRVGYEDGWSYAGGSFAVDPSGREIGRARALRAQSVAVTLDPRRLAAARAAAPMLRDEKLDLVRRELERIALARYGVSTA
ncbi:MAG: nitrilase-related carbon-nitrogen hydrolase [Candidatus Polarisedimenticolia bacterium]